MTDQNTQHAAPRLDQKGMASIVITMVTMVVISLIVLGFATISRREQTQTLDQQLSTQAFYAAESGVEDARNVIEAALQAGKPVPAKADCDTNTTSGYTPNYPVGAATTLDSAHNVSYSCLLIDPTPPVLKYSGIGEDSLVIPITASDTIDTLVIKWTPTTPPSGSPSSCPSSTTSSFTPQPNWQCGYGLMRMDLMPTEGALTRGGMLTSTLTAFFEPTRNAASGQLSYAGNTNNKANVVAANCNTVSYTQCTATITGLGGAKSVALRLNSLYQPSDITIEPYHGGTPIEVSGAQAIVDVTGKASDVLRRIQVRIPVVSSSQMSSFAIQSNGSLCKRFMTTPGYLKIPGDILDPDPANNMCAAQTYGTPAASIP